MSINLKFKIVEAHEDTVHINDQTRNQTFKHLDQDSQFRCVPHGMGGMYQSERILVCEPPSTRWYQCFNQYQDIPTNTTPDFDLYRGKPVGMT